MQLPLQYSAFIKNYGLPLSQWNPGSSEVALNKEDSLKALDILEDSQIVISGGDVVRISLGKLDYVYANWSCSKEGNENQMEFAKRSRRVAREYVENFHPIEEGYVPLFVFVIP